MPEPQYTPANRPKILVVDDYADSRDVFRTLLNVSGFDVFTAADGEEALATAIAAAPHLVILDLSLPGMSGVEVARALRARDQDRPLPLVALTGHSDPDRLQQARDAGFDLVLTKPCEPSKLLEEIRRLIAAGRSGD